MIKNIRVLLFLVLITLPLAMAQTQQKNDDRIFRQFWIFAEAIHNIQQRTFRAINIQEIIHAGLRAMLSAVDAHSAFFSPQSYKSTLEFAAGQFPGVGISVINKAVDADELTIVDVIQDGPAEQAGIKSSEKIVAINNKKLKGLSTDECVALLKGKLHTPVTITLLRNRKPVSITMNREIIKEVVCKGLHLADHAMWYIRIKEFNEKTAPKVAEELEQSRKNKCSAVILDIRKNPGGLLEAAIDTAGHFVPGSSLIVTTKNNKQEAVRHYKTTTTPIHDPHTPIFIITDPFTASSAEILVGSLRYYAQQDGRIAPLVFTVGLPTYGKGSVQEVIPISNGCALKLTTMMYYLPDDSCIQTTGIAPDFTVYPKHTPSDELAWITEMYGKEDSLANHITAHELGKTPKKRAPLRKQEELSEIEKLTQDAAIRFCLQLQKLYRLAITQLPAATQTYNDMLSFLKEHAVCDTPL